MRCCWVLFGVEPEHAIIRTCEPLAPCFFNTGQNGGSIPFSTCFNLFSWQQFAFGDIRRRPRSRASVRGRIPRREDSWDRPFFFPFFGNAAFWCVLHVSSLWCFLEIPQARQKAHVWTYVNIIEYPFLKLSTELYLIVSVLNLRQVCWGQLRKLTIYWPMPSAASHWEESGMSLPNRCGTRKRQVAIDMFPTLSPRWRKSC